MAASAKELPGVTRAALADTGTSSSAIGLAELQLQPLAQAGSSSAVDLEKEGKNEEKDLSVPSTKEEVDSKDGSKGFQLTDQTLVRYIC